MSENEVKIPEPSASELLPYRLIGKLQLTDDFEDVGDGESGPQLRGGYFLNGRVADHVWDGDDDKLHEIIVHEDGSWEIWRLDDDFRPSLTSENHKTR